MFGRTTQLVVIIIIESVYIWLVGGCTVSQFTPVSQDCDSIPSSPMPANLPVFLEKVYPPPDSTITQECYRKNLADMSRSGIHGVIWVKELVESGDHLNQNMIIERTRISIDSVPSKDTDGGIVLEASLFQKRDRQGNVTTSYPGPRTWVILPGIPKAGQHTATIQAIKTSGDILEYSWTFTLVP